MFYIGEINYITLTKYQVSTSNNVSVHHATSFLWLCIITSNN